MSRNHPTSCPMQDPGFRRALINEIADVVVKRLASAQAAPQDPVEAGAALLADPTRLRGLVHTVMQSIAVPQGSAASSQLQRLGVQRLPVHKETIPDEEEG